ncbi:MAG TPA: methyltransferase [Spirochaetota bacterium]|nr:methyltransferase [Spirochaetota bacterium]HPP03213.1 methyltransferase [Spirochaetota bacterium]
MFEDWYLNDLINKTIRDIWKLTDYYLLKLIDDILVKTDIKNILNDFTTLENIIANKGYEDKVKNALKWILDRLSLDGYIEIKEENSDFLYKWGNKKIDYNLEEIRKKAFNEAPDSIAAFNMLQLMADNYPDFLSSKKSGVDIIFSPENINITNEYYSNNLFYNVHNIAGAKILNWDISQRENPTIIEIGGGMGGGTKQFLIQRLQEKLPLNNFKYIFTDIANKMLRTTKKDLLTITEDLNAFDFRKLDFNMDLTSQGYEPESADVVWGVNAIHVAYDLRFSLNEILKTLKKGGSFIIVETVRPVGNKMIQQEFILNTLSDYWNVKLDKDIRPRHGFMEWRDWVNALNNAGFKDVKTIPDMSILEQKYDNCYVAVIRGIKE